PPTQARVRSPGPGFLSPSAVWRYLLLRGLARPPSFTLARSIFQARSCFCPLVCLGIIPPHSSDFRQNHLYVQSRVNWRRRLSIKIWPEDTETGTDAELQSLGGAARTRHALKKVEVTRCARGQAFTTGLAGGHGR